jgi:hypothetical protein
MLSREAAAKLSRALSATKPEVPVQIEPAPAALAKKAPSEKGAETKAAAPKGAKKSAAAKKEKPKAKPKGKKG